MKTNLKKTIMMHCNLCDSEDLFLNETESYAKCNSCGNEFLGGKNELLQLNSKRIELAQKEFGEMISDEIVKSLKDSFRGSKFIKFK